MALTTQESNFVSRIQSKAEILLDLRDDLQREVALYNAEGFGASITTEDLTAAVGDRPAPFSNLTAGKIADCITAFSGVLTALGNDASGQSVNLIKMRS